MDDETRRAFTDLTALINTNTEQLLNSLDAIREDITVLGGGNDQTRLLGDNTRAELRSLADLVAALQRAQLKHSTRLDDIERRLPR